MKRGDRVRHQGGWLATVTEVRLNTVVVKADDPRYSGEYSSVMFDGSTMFEVDKGASSTQPVVETPTTEGP